MVGRYSRLDGRALIYDFDDFDQSCRVRLRPGDKGAIKHRIFAAAKMVVSQEENRVILTCPWSLTV